MDLKKNGGIFKIQLKLNLGDKFLKFLSSINLSLGHVMSHTKFGPPPVVLTFIGYKRTDKQTNRQANHILLGVGRFAPISFNCDHVLFVYCKTKISRIKTKISWILKIVKIVEIS